jgi:hypothetical protein
MVGKISVWATVFLLVSLCSCTTQKEQEDHLVWEMIANQTVGKSDYSYEDKARITVVTDVNEAQALRGQVYPEILEQVRKTDFSAFFVIAVFQGEKGSTGYSVEVTDVQRKDNTITIYAQFHEPAPDAITNPLVTSPYYILKVEKMEGIKGEFTFVLIAGDIEVARQVHTIP